MEPKINETLSPPEASNVPTPSQKPLYGWYSETQRKNGGTVIWRTPTGENVEVTSVSPQPPRFDDAINKGEVVEWISGQLQFYGFTRGTHRDL